jgi:hypothetical protein
MPEPYLAYCGPDFIDSADSLDELLESLDTLLESDPQEDVVVWLETKLVLVIRGDGSLLWVHGERQVTA